MAVAYVGLGANLGDREATIHDAIGRLGELDGIERMAVSTLRETEPWGPVPQPPYLNGALRLQTTLSPRQLLDALLAVERALGRARDVEVRYGPRPIDLDLLLYDDVQLDEDSLTLPHPRLHERAFALEPLVELDPDLELPGHGRAADVLAAIEASG